MKPAAVLEALNKYLAEAILSRFMHTRDRIAINQEDNYLQEEAAIGLSPEPAIRDPVRRDGSSRFQCNDFDLAFITKMAYGSHGQRHGEAEGATRVAWPIQGSRR